jgi:uncharacterized protein
MKTFLVSAAVLLSAIFLSAEPIATLEPTGRVNDFANVIDNASRIKLEDACREIDAKAHAQIIIVTVNSLDGANIYDYSLGLFKQWGIGTKPANRGVLILLAIQDHRYRITVGSGLDSILKEGNVAGFGLEAVPFLKRSDYGTAALLMTSRVARVIANDVGVALPPFLPPTLQSPEERAAYNALELQHPDRAIDSNAGLILLIVCVALTLAVYLVIQYGKRRQPYRSVGITPETNDNVYVSSGPTSIFANTATAGSIWSSADTSSSNTSSSFGSTDSGGSFGGDTSSGCGGGDTSGGGAGGSW